MQLTVWRTPRLELTWKPEGGAFRNAPAVPAPGGRGELILVADDDEAVRELLKRGLEEHGYSVMVAGHGAEAVSVFKEHSGTISLLITDQSMPVLDGARAAAAIMELRADVPVIFLSGESDGGDEERTGVPGNAQHLSKPIELDSLLRAVHRGLG